jgi:hypothetical protein
MQPAVVIFSECDFENELFVVLCYQQGFGRGSLTQLPFDHEALR